MRAGRRRRLPRISYKFAAQFSGGRCAVRMRRCTRDGTGRSRDARKPHQAPPSLQHTKRRLHSLRRPRRARLMLLALERGEHRAALRRSAGARVQRVACACSASTRRAPQQAASSLSSRRRSRRSRKRLRRRSARSKRVGLVHAAWLSTGGPVSVLRAERAREAATSRAFARASVESDADGGSGGGAAMPSMVEDQPLFVPQWTSTKRGKGGSASARSSRPAAMSRFARRAAHDSWRAHNAQRVASAHSEARRVVPAQRWIRAAAAGMYTESCAPSAASVSAPRRS